MRLGTRRRHSGSPTFILVMVLLAVFIVSVVTAKRLQPAFVAQAHSYANTMVTDVIEQSVNEVLSKGDYSKTVHTGNDGGVASLEADTVKINKLKSELTVKIQNDIIQKCNSKIYIPIGSASGLYLLSGAGPKIPVSIYPAAIVNTNYEEKFESAGINQVRHSVAINVDVQMRYTGYMLNECETINTDVPVLETIIVGGVPSYYGAQAGIVAD